MINDIDDYFASNDRFLWILKFRYYRDYFKTFDS